jgi:putative ABC transport system ATP-binding protein
MQIELKNIHLHFADKPPLMQGLNFVLQEGDFALVHGTSGCGKSSLLRLLNRLQEPSAGTIHLDGRPADSYEVTELRRQLGFVQQTPVMVDGTVRDNLLYPFRFKTRRGQSAPNDERLRSLLDEFLLEEVALQDDATSLSVGQKQRIALIRTLIVEPQVLLCDEPTSALDPRSKEIVEDALERANGERGIGVVLVTHLDFVPKKIDVKRYEMRDGRLNETL